MFGISGVTIVRFHIELDGTVIESADTLENAFRIALGVLAGRGLGRQEVRVTTVRTKDGRALFMAPDAADTGVSIHAVIA